MAPNPPPSPTRALTAATLLLLLAGTAAAINQIGPISFYDADGSSISSDDLNHLLEELIYEASETDYHAAHVGGTYGLFVCSDDASQPVCLSCVQQAAEYISYNQTSNSSDASVWFDLCFLRYSTVDFFGSIDSARDYIQKAFCTGRSTTDAEDSEISALLAGFASQAAERPTMFASTRNASMYVAAQCTRDLGRETCSSCLQVGVRRVASYCRRRGGGSFFSLGCSLRYLNSSSVHLTQPPPGYPRRVKMPSASAGGRRAAAAYLLMWILVFAVSFIYQL